MKKMFLFFTVASWILGLLLSGCGRQIERGDNLPIEENGVEKKLSPKRNAEIERLLKEYSYNFDNVKNLGDFFNALADAMGIDVVIEAKRILPETTIDLKNSKDSFIIQILETVTASTETRYEISRGKIWIKDAR